MIRLLQFLIHGCAHVWEDTDESRYNDTDPFSGKTFRSGPIVYCRCQKCGRHTFFKDATMGVQKDA